LKGKLQSYSQRLINIDVVILSRTQQQPLSLITFIIPQTPSSILERKKKMAEGVLFDLAGKVLEVAGSFALQEIKLASGVKADLDNLKSTVSTIKDVLLDAEKKAYDSSAIKGWLERLKDVLLDADDLLDDFSTEALQRKVMTGNKMTKEVRIFFSSSNQLAFSLKMGHRIKAIRKSLNAIAKDKEDFLLYQNSIEPQVKNKARETYSYVLEEEVIGREDDKKKL
jgi:hypothetical protein